MIRYSKTYGNKLKTIIDSTDNSSRNGGVLLLSNSKCWKSISKKNINGNKYDTKAKKLNLTLKNSNK